MRTMPGTVDEVDEAELLRRVVVDYAETCCDHLLTCDCSMARAYRRVNQIHG
jgi:hypothetical protein